STVTATLNAAVSNLTYSASGSTSYQVQINKLKTFRSSVVYMNGVLPTGSALPQINMADLIDFCLGYPRLLDVQTNNRVISLELDDVNNIGGGLITGDPVDREKFRRQATVYHELVESLENFYDWKNDIDYVTNNSAQFAPATVTAAST